MPAPFSHFSSLWRNPTAAPLRPTPGGTSSTGNADPFFTRSLFSLKKNRRRERERETPNLLLLLLLLLPLSLPSARRNLGLGVRLNAGL